ncbi:uncharacterized protein YALI1_C07664g [Yarrowia lipolytica]|uniref:Uncharacterized protein n=1 Tax=Yarrowia lipolytica TaxID=4952 RepID=A0A1D8N9W3_YARLL|nr:hypothetical protein YALI1_C07664g [Yarrowia lipolytica]
MNICDKTMSSKRLELGLRPETRPVRTIAFGPMVLGDVTGAAPKIATKTRPSSYSRDPDLKISASCFQNVHWDYYSRNQL